MKLEEEKKEVRQEVDKRYEELMLKEKEKFEIKVTYLMNMNETLNARVEDYQKLEPEYQDRVKRLEKDLQTKENHLQEVQRAHDSLLPEHKAVAQKTIELEEALNATTSKLHDVEDRARADFAD